MAKKKGELLITIGEDLFEVSRFVPNHPGEGIHDVYLQHYARKSVTEEFEHYHYDNEPDEWISKAKELGFDPETGIHFIGSIGNWFKKKIPIWFHVFQNEEAEENYFQLQSKKRMSFG